jgi:coenzyme F420-0:L-glutamate ligase
MKLYAIETGVIEIGDNLVKATLNGLKRQKLQLENNDILALTSKIVSYAQGRVARLKECKPSSEAKKLAQQYSLQPEFAQLVLQEADKLYGGVLKAVLTLKDGVLTANAGIDNKNAPEGFVVLWPENPEMFARNFREEIKRKTGLRVGVLIVDSGLVPLRIGTNGFALAVAGFKPVRDHRKERDLYGKPIVITRHAVADDLASAAHLLMGEANEKTPLVLIKDAPVDFDDNAYGGSDMMMPPKECIFMNPFLNALHSLE